MKKPDSLDQGIELQMFKYNIKPLWEDDNNKNGGRFSLRLKKDMSNSVWEEIVLDVISDELEEEIRNEINGLVISIRKDFNFIQIWFKNYSSPQVKKIE